jgi:D-alanyl-D-alanine carboxypeptidase (penicillin-binding protein 5/6)
MTTAATDALRGPQAEIAPPAGDLPAIPAAAYLVLDGDTGDTLASYNADQPRPVASLTKLMTARLVLDEGPLDASRAGLLQAMLIASDNDAARDLAVDVAGSERRFVGLMNAEAAAAGLDDTRYANPHGLDDPDQHSSAADVAHLARELMGDPIFRQIVAAENTQADGSGSPTTNDLLGTYPGADGIKTGHTDEAGLCLAASATRDGQSVIAVVLGAPTEQARDDAARALLDHGFRQAGVTDLGDAGDGATPPAPPTAGSSPPPPTRTPPPRPRRASGSLVR